MDIFFPVLRLGRKAKDRQCYKRNPKGSGAANPLVCVCRSITFPECTTNHGRSSESRGGGGEIEFEESFFPILDRCGMEFRLRLPRSERALGLGWKDCHLDGSFRTMPFGSGRELYGVKA
ncbi:hypothetical protein CEXT_794571 [Caerostris extrusa]|uniref:Uncharacterized protein n=1 Tax=Caerostris extrusa TaxID=172846 RepID=A0AAV4WPQ5_CAEEX|nr:hypothetical protein CEXT_794571 [Caerostris extrusa]